MILTFSECPSIMPTGLAYDSPNAGGRGEDNWRKRGVAETDGGVSTYACLIVAELPL
jgi:hypothetical protein